jgi:hypothetical protein
MPVVWTGASDYAIFDVCRAVDGFRKHGIMWAIGRVWSGNVPGRHVRDELQLTQYSWR